MSGTDHQTDVTQSPRRTAWVGAGLLLVALVASACSFRAAGSSSSPTSSPPETSASGSASPGAASSGTSAANGGSTAPASQRCTTDELSGRLEPGSPGAGQRYATVILTNTSLRSCTVFGYGGVGLAGADGAALPTHQVRVSDPPPQTVVVPPGGTVSSQLHWSVVPGPGDATSGDCQPTPATLQVIPPDETTALTVPWTLGPVCEAGTIQQQAYAG